MRAPCCVLRPLGGFLSLPGSGMMSCAHRLARPGRFERRGRGHGGGHLDADHQHLRQARQAMGPRRGWPRVREPRERAHAAGQVKAKGAGVVRSCLRRQGPRSPPLCRSRLSRCARAHACTAQAPGGSAGLRRIDQPVPLGPRPRAQQASAACVWAVAAPGVGSCTLRRA